MNPVPGMREAGRVSHGGPDGGPPIAHDFSTNANAAGPAPGVLAAVLAADRARYPDPGHGALRATLAARLGVEAARILPCAGSSEGIGRLALAARLHGARKVWVPEPGYGDYARTARVLGLPVRGWADADALLRGLRADPGPALVWACEPCNPTGASLEAGDWPRIARAVRETGAVLAIDRAYEPLRLRGTDPVPVDVAAGAWQWWSLNKACGLTGVRAAFGVAPVADADPAALRDTVSALAPGWVLGAEAVAFLDAATSPATADWLHRARMMLVEWEAPQRAMLEARGWTLRPSVAPFFLARPPWPVERVRAKLDALRARGIRLRDATGFGLPGWLRLSVQPPAARDALRQALDGMDERRAA